MNKPEYLYGIIDNKVIQFEIIKELDYYYNCIYYFNNEWYSIGIPKDKIHKDYFLNYKRCENKLKIKKRMEYIENNWETINESLNKIIDEILKEEVKNEN